MQTGGAAQTDSVEVPQPLGATPSTISGKEEATAVVRALMEGLRNEPDTADNLHGDSKPSDRLAALLKE